MVMHVDRLAIIWQIIIWQNFKAGWSKEILKISGRLPAKLGRLATMSPVSITEVWHDDVGVCLL